MRIGAHLSIAKGLDKSVVLARDIGANTFQYFTRNPRGGAARTISPQEIDKWLVLREEADLFPIVGHLPYTVNPGTPKDDLWEFAKRVLAEDLARVDAMGGEYLVVHPGSHLGAGKEAGIKRITDALAEVLLPFQGQTKLLLETMAGYGSEIGGDLKELDLIMNVLGYPPQLGVCLDSCHLFAAGYDLTDDEGIDRLLNDIDTTFGRERVHVIHLNDSKMPLGSRKDRHAFIGQGFLGVAGIKKIINHPFLGQLPLILETPVEDYLDYGKEISLTKELID